jgi:hydroxyethylthiazole kinase-like sugar kinase family protein
MTTKLDGKSIAEQVVAGGILLGAGAAGALAYEHRHSFKAMMKAAKARAKKKTKR